MCAWIKERRRPEEEVQEEETGSGSEVGPEGCAETLLNNETLLNESLWNLIKLPKHSETCRTRNSIRVAPQYVLSAVTSASDQKCLMTQS